MLNRRKFCFCLCWNQDSAKRDSAKRDSAERDSAKTGFCETGFGENGIRRNGFLRNGIRRSGFLRNGIRRNGIRRNGREPSFRVSFLVFSCLFVSFRLLDVQVIMSSVSDNITFINFGIFLKVLLFQFEKQKFTIKKINLHLRYLFKKFVAYLLCEKMRLNFYFCFQPIINAQSASLRCW